jgi:hypothetical protein
MITGVLLRPGVLGAVAPVLVVATRIEHLPAGSSPNGEGAPGRAP